MFRRFTEKQKEWLKKNNYYSLKELTEKFNEKFNENRTYDVIRRITLIYKLRDPRNGDFKKGNIPWNKGKHGVQKNIKGCFQKDGLITIHLDKNRRNNNKSNLLTLPLKEFAQVNNIYKLKKNEPTLNKAKILLIQLKYKLNHYNDKKPLQQVNKDKKR